MEYSTQMSELDPIGMSVGPNGWDMLMLRGNPIHKKFTLLVVAHIGTTLYFLDVIASPKQLPLSVSGSVSDSWFQIGDSYRISELCKLVFQQAMNVL